MNMASPISVRRRPPNANASLLKWIMIAVGGMAGLLLGALLLLMFGVQNGIVGLLHQVAVLIFGGADLAFEPVGVPLDRHAGAVLPVVRRVVEHVHDARTLSRMSASVDVDVVSELHRDLPVHQAGHLVAADHRLDAEDHPDRAAGAGGAGPEVAGRPRLGDRAQVAGALHGLRHGVSRTGTGSNPRRMRSYRGSDSPDA